MDDKRLQTAIAGPTATKPGSLINGLLLRSVGLFQMFHRLGEPLGEGLVPWPER